MCAKRLSLTLAVALLFCLPPAYSQSMQEHAHTKAVPSTELQLTMDGKTSAITLEELAAMPQKTVKVHDEHSKKDEVYTGVALGDLLAKYGFAVGPTTHRKMLRSYLSAEGTDHYWVLYSATEIENTEHDAEVIVATEVDGTPLGDDGKLKLVASADKKPQRWVRNLSAIRLITVGE
jgi:hypothetical protein